MRDEGGGARWVARCYVGPWKYGLRNASSGLALKPSFIPRGHLMAEATIRERVLRLVEEMPSDVTWEDVMERIYLLQKVERGRQQIAAGQGISHAEAKQRMKRWHE